MLPSALSPLKLVVALTRCGPGCVSINAIPAGGDTGLSTSERQHLKALEREVRELRRNNDILRQACVFCPGGVRPPLEEIMPLLDGLSGTYGVGPACRELDITPSTYYWHRLRMRCPEQRSSRYQHDAQLKEEIQRVHEENYNVYDYRKVWHQLQREGISVARCTVARLMNAIHLCGVIRGKGVNTTRSSRGETPCDRVSASSWLGVQSSCGVLILPMSAPSKASPMWRLLSMYSPGLSWDGGSHRRWKRRWCWMRWSRLCGTDAHQARSTIAIKALSMYRWRTYKGCRMRRCWRQQAAQVIRTITRWQKASTGCTNRR